MFALLRIIQYQFRCILSSFTEQEAHSGTRYNKYLRPLLKISAERFARRELRPVRHRLTSANIELTLARFRLVFWESWLNDAFSLLGVPLNGLTQHKIRLYCCCREVQLRKYPLYDQMSILPYYSP